MHWLQNVSMRLSVFVHLTAAVKSIITRLVYQLGMTNRLERPSFFTKFFKFKNLET